MPRHRQHYRPMVHPYFGLLAFLSGILALGLLTSGCKRQAVGGCQEALCDGCCVGELCRPGTEDQACGRGGKACLDCTSEGLVCTPSGGCGPPCDPGTCQGCCDEHNQCLGGTDDSACGQGGLPCASCPDRSYCDDSRLCHPAVPCLPTSCPGCCDADGRCRAGMSDAACGTDGEPCASCAALGGLCQEPGVCVDQVELCGPDTCQGCCDEEGRCRVGGTPELCGLGGAACQDCGLLVCEEGACQQGCQDRDGDGYGPGCALGPDCDDLAPGITGPCQEDGCPDGWVLVPEGEFVMGCDNVDLGCTGLAGFSHPRHLVYLTPYCIKRTKMTVAEWRACHEVGHCLLPPCDPATRRDCFYSDIQGDNDRFAVVGPGWFTARWLCGAWYGGDLPTGAQWEKAARGTDGRAWPWGNEPEPSCEMAPLWGCAGYFSDVEAFAAYSSPFGLPDSYGWPEWVQDMFVDIEYPPCPEPCVDPVYVLFDPILAPDLGLWSTVRGDAGWPPPRGKTYSSVAARSYWLVRQQLPEEWGRGPSLRCARRVASP